MSSTRSRRPSRSSTRGGPATASGSADVVADNTSAAGYVVGEWVSLRDVRDAEARWLVDGDLVVTTSPAAILGDPRRAVVHLSRHLAARGEVLPAGSIVLAAR